MQILAIGDIHGRNDWKAVKDREADRIIFIGDYVDPHAPIPDLDVIRNLEEIIDFKKSQPDRVTLLLGNHDAQYLHFSKYQCGGHRADLQETFGGLFGQNADLFQIAWQHDRYLFTHAGLSTRWYARLLSIKKEFEANTSADLLNAVYHSETYRDILFEVGPQRGGCYEYGGPIWADRMETRYDYIPGLHQVVGHSRVPDFEHHGDENASITFIDTGDTRFLVWES